MSVGKKSHFSMRRPEVHTGRGRPIPGQECMSSGSPCSGNRYRGAVSGCKARAREGRLAICHSFGGAGAGSTIHQKGQKIHSESESESSEGSAGSQDAIFNLLSRARKQRPDLGISFDAGEKKLDAGYPESPK